MKIYKAYIEIICGEYSFGNNYLVVAKNIKEAEKKVKEYIDEENEASQGETLYKCDEINEFNFLEGYKVNYKLRKL